MCTLNTHAPRKLSQWQRITAHTRMDTHTRALSRGFPWQQNKQDSSSLKVEYMWWHKMTRIYCICWDLTCCLAVLRFLRFKTYFHMLQGSDTSNHWVPWGHVWMIVVFAAWSARLAVVSPHQQPLADWIFWTVVEASWCLHLVKLLHITPFLLP